MSSLAPAPDAAGPRARPAGHPPRLHVTGEALLGLAIAGAFSLLAFTTKGGNWLGADTAFELVMLALAASLGVALVLSGSRGRRSGVGALCAFAALSVLTYASIAWSVQPALSWIEGDRTLAYLLAFAASMAVARLAPGRWRAVIWGVAIYTVVVSTYGLLSKVFPASLGGAVTTGRLRAPFDYFNAVGLAAALGIPAWLWIAAARRPAGRLSTALSVPAVALLVTALILSLGRGAVLAALVGLAVWFAVVPSRLRAALVLGLGAAGGGIVSAWATGDSVLVHDYQALPARVSAGHRFGVVLLIALLVLLAVGVAVAVGFDRVRLAEATRRRIGLVLIVLLCLVPVAGVVGLAASSRGFGGEVSHLWSSLTNPKGVATNSAGRLATLGSSRPKYWGDGITVGAHAPLAGTGAYGFSTAHLRYSGDHVQEAHSYAVQTWADFGAIGLVVSAVLLVAWGLAVRRTLSRSPEGADDGSAGAERAGLVTLLSITLVFGVHSSIDWTWFIPGVAVPALVCAGWLAGRGPVSASAGGFRLRSVAAEPLRGAAALGLVTVALVIGWFVWQPLRSSDAVTAALSAPSTGAALADARTAASANPVDYVPHIVLSEIYAAVGLDARARAERAKAVSVQPSNPIPWLWLAGFDAFHGRPVEARREFARAQALDPYRGLSLSTLASYR